VAGVVAIGAYFDEAVGVNMDNERLKLLQEYENKVIPCVIIDAVYDFYIKNP
jgi:hypothetical protein